MHPHCTCRASRKKLDKLTLTALQLQVRGYGKYLDEQLEVYQKVSFYQEQERPGDASKLRSMPAAQLLSQLPHLQRLLQRLLDCKPAGAASHDIVVQVRCQRSCFD